VSIALEGRDVTVVMQTLRIEGRLGDDGETIEAHLLKGDSKTPLTFQRRPPGAAPPLAQRAPAIELSPEALARFAGRYAYETGTVVTLALREGRLWYEVSSGGPPLDLVASGTTTFFFRILEASVEFELDDQGAVTALVQSHGGRQTRAPRLP
jgi:hypothetical protein